MLGLVKSDCYKIMDETISEPESELSGVTWTLEALDKARDMLLLEALNIRFSILPGARIFRVSFQWSVLAGLIENDIIDFPLPEKDTVIHHKMDVTASYEDENGIYHLAGYVKNNKGETTVSIAYTNNAAYGVVMASDRQYVILTFKGKIYLLVLSSPTA